jgi:hypothetical protein
MDQSTATLEEREARIEEAERNNYIVRGRELGAIRDGEWWRRRYNFKSFEEYCEERWELDDNHARRLILASSFAERCQLASLSLPSRESHIRPLLSRLQADDDRLAVWRDVLATTNGARIKATDIENAVTAGFEAKTSR